MVYVLYNNNIISSYIIIFERDNNIIKYYIIIYNNGFYKKS